MNLNKVVIHTTRLRLIPIRKEHIDEIFENFTTDITKYMYPQPTGDIKDTEAFVIDSIEGLKKGNNLQMVIIDTEDGDFIGCAGLHHLEQPDPELGIWIKKKAHGRGLGLEAMNGLIRWAKENLRFDHLKYPVDRNNHASKRIPVMNGGKLMKEYMSVNQNGESMDIVEYWIFIYSIAMIKLKEMSMDNFHPVINLKLTDDDKRMVANNMYSLAEAYCDKVSKARAIYKDRTLVGFIMYDYNKAERKGYISRLMIASEFQGSGYGTEALRIAIKDLKKSKKIIQIQISYHPDNEKARKSYTKVGFVETDEYVDGEVIALLDFVEVIMNIIDWLLEGDVSIQYQVHRDLLDSSKELLDKLQMRIESEGFGKKFLDCKYNKGYLGRGIYSPKWTSLHYTLYDLYWLGIAPNNEIYKNNAEYLLDTLWFNKGLVRKNQMQDICMSAMFIQMATYAKVNNPKIFEIVDYLLDKQYTDGGWNCFWYLNHKHASLHTTLTTLEAFKEYLDNGYTYKKNEILQAIPKGESFILRKEFYKSERTKEIISEQFLRFPFPSRWHYDIVRALNYFRKSKRQYDIRMEPALQRLLKINKNGYFRKYSRFQGLIHFSMEDDTLKSRWNTLRALRVLKAYKPEDYQQIIKNTNTL